MKADTNEQGKKENPGEIVDFLLVARLWLLLDEDRPSGTPAVFQFTMVGHFCCFVCAIGFTLYSTVDTAQKTNFVPGFCTAQT